MASSLIPDSNKTKHWCISFAMKNTAFSFSVFHLLSNVVQSKNSLELSKEQSIFVRPQPKNLPIIYTDLNIDTELELSTDCGSFLEECSWMDRKLVYSSCTWGCERNSAICQPWHRLENARICFLFLNESVTSVKLLHSCLHLISLLLFCISLKEKLGQSLAQGGAQCRTTSFSVPVCKCVALQLWLVSSLRSWIHTEKKCYPFYP